MALAIVLLSVVPAVVIGVRLGLDGNWEGVGMLAAFLAAMAFSIGLVVWAIMPTRDSGDGSGVSRD